MDTITACARENAIAVSLGFSENDDDSLYIAQALIGADGEIKVHRRKMKPTHMERTIFGDAAGGSCLASVAQLPLARVGQLSCWEHIQPLLKFNTIAQREQIHVAAWPSVTPHSGTGPDLWSMSAEGEWFLPPFYLAPVVRLTIPEAAKRWPESMRLRLPHLSCIAQPFSPTRPSRPMAPRARP